MRSFDSGPSLAERVSSLRGVIDGAAIEYDLRDYERIVRKSRAIDLWGETDLAALASAMRSRLSRVSRAGDERAPGLEPRLARELPLATALFAEAARRALGMRPFGSQLIAGVAMSLGKLAQLNTGEGKTLAAVLPASLGAAAGRGVHVMTANDYLARRDARWMGPAYALLGLRAAAVSAGSSAEERRDAYAADVTYLTAKEAGFDYLRDQLRYDASEIVQREFEWAIVDEADSILIDEARSPLVIAARSDIDGLGPMEADAVARSLAAGRDYSVDTAFRRVALTLEGEGRVARLLGSDGMHEEGAQTAFARVHAALYARSYLSRDIDYVVKGGRALLVDEHTGRTADDRRWPYGIQAAVEAKEGIETLPEGRIYGSIAVQYLLDLYPRLAAMTATAVPSAAEFGQAYGLAVVVVPPQRPSRRIDAPDRLYRTRAGKLRAVAAEALREGASGRPVLVGTGSVRESEELAALIRAGGGECVVLNAKDDEREAELIAAAGMPGALTISTNMAGRGTDIKLGGGGPPAAGDRAAGAAIVDDATRERLFAQGGLYVIGTDRHESKRIDDQLRGRAGRQGEPGLARFFVSLEDPLFERYGVRDFLPREHRARLDPALAEALDEKGPIEDPRVLREVDRAQRIIAGTNASLRRSLRKFGLILEIDRRRARELRDRALLGGVLPAPVDAVLARNPRFPRRRAILAYLGRLDRSWAEHLLFADDLREGIDLVRYAGRNPGLEYIRALAEAFELRMDEAERAAADDVERAIAEGQEGDCPSPRSAVEAAPLDLPTGTWTYIMEEESLPAFTLPSGATGALAAFASIPALPLLAFGWIAARLRRFPAALARAAARERPRRPK